MNSLHLRARFTDGGLATASAPKVVVLCYDRLERDITTAIDAIERRDIETAHHALLHAQDLVVELRLLLESSEWEHSATLSSIYAFVVDLLTAANVKKSAREAVQARGLLRELGDAFRTAAASLLAPAPELDRPSASPTGGLPVSVLA